MKYSQETVTEAIRALIEEEQLPEDLCRVAQMYYGIDRERLALPTIKRELRISSKALKYKIDTLENKIFNILKKRG